MQQTDASNTVFKLAADFVNNTSRHIFLTGKAGTGKTTFLKHVKEHTNKRSIVIAPTGVAAINAGGVTMHSFFQLPFGPFIPVNQPGFADYTNNVADKNSLFKNIRFNSDKRELLQELELLIIDEVSMVRADMLDAMDTILRHFRKNYHQPFGGVQVLYIGDMYQLPPVVNNNEWDILQPFYESPFFFSAKVIADAPPLYIELKKIYRQSDQLFIDVLNRVRNNQVTADDLMLLNERYQPDFTPPKEDKYVTLSTHNRKTEAINAAELEKLPGEMTLFAGSVSGDFSDKAFPTDMNLQLKEGAQVMFIKNDSGTERKFFNGKLATVKQMSGERLIVTAHDNEHEELVVEKETWLNIRYNLNKATNRIDEEELGSFTQYPLRLAWAITIHKSQGLTFEKAIIDAGASFAAGQVYVALSRCTSLQGMVLLSQLSRNAIATDHRVIAFAQKEAAADALQQMLAQEQKQYWADNLGKTFDWKKITAAVDHFREISAGKKLPDNQANADLRAFLFNKSKEHAVVAQRFQQQLVYLFPAVLHTNDTRLLEERVNKAIAYFVKCIAEDLVRPLQEHIETLQHAPKLKKYVADLSVIAQVFIQHQQNITQACYGELVFCKDPSVYDPYFTSSTTTEFEGKARKGKQIKGESQAETLALFKEGKTIAEIAVLRQLAESTITAHLSMFVKTGELNVRELLSDEKINAILPVVNEIGGDVVSSIKEILGDAFSFAEIRIVMNHCYSLQEKKVNA